MYRCSRKGLFLESVSLHLRSDSLALLNLEMFPFPPCNTLKNVYSFNS